MKNISDLQQKIYDLDIPMENRKYSKDELIQVLQNYYKRSLPFVPNHLEKMTKITPMLCQQIKVLKKHEVDKIWSSNDFIFEEKFDGCRIIIIYDEQTGFHLYGRHLSEVDFLPVNYDNKIVLNVTGKLPNNIKSFVLDTELLSSTKTISTEGIIKNGTTTVTQLQAVTSILGLKEVIDCIKVQNKHGNPLYFQGIDVLEYNNESLINKPLKQRLEIKDAIVSCLIDINFPIKKANICFKSSEKKSFYDKIISANGEGVVAKNINSLYSMSNNRTKDWVKIKRTLTNSALGDSFDVFVTGYKIGDEDVNRGDIVDTIILSIYLKDKDGNLTLHEIANISSLPMNDKIEMTEFVNGVPKLKMQYFNKVCSIDGQTISKNLKLKHATFNEWRIDKNYHDCIYEEENLKRLIF